MHLHHSVMIMEHSRFHNNYASYINLYILRLFTHVLLWRRFMVGIFNHNLTISLARSVYFGKTVAEPTVYWHA